MQIITFYVLINSAFVGKNSLVLLLCCFMWGCHMGCMIPFMLCGNAALCVFGFRHFSHHFVFVHSSVTFLNMLESTWLMYGHYYIWQFALLLTLFCVTACVTALTTVPVCCELHSACSNCYVYSEVFTHII